MITQESWDIFRGGGGGGGGVKPALTGISSLTYLEFTASLQILKKPFQCYLINRDLTRFSPHNIIMA